MDAIEHLEENKWQKESCYVGHQPEGYVVYSRNRDSCIAENVNYQEILKDLEKLSEELQTESAVYDFRASHWSVGWVEYIIVPTEAPDRLKQVAGEMLCALSDYPLYKEDKVSEAECEARQEYWKECSISERIELIKEHNPECSIFAARRDYYSTDVDHNGSFLEEIY